jgi:CRP/FNR family transcriptional regulator
MILENNWRNSFPNLARFPAEVTRVLDTQARPIRLQKTTVFDSGKCAVQHLLQLAAGAVRFHNQSGSEGEITIYRVPSTAFISRSDVDALVIPRDAFDTLMFRSQEFRAFVFEIYAKQIEDLCAVIRPPVKHAQHPSQTLPV